MSSDVKYKVRLRAQFGDIGPLEVPGTFSVESLAAEAFESWPKGTTEWIINILYIELSTLSKTDSLHAWRVKVY